MLFVSPTNLHCSQTPCLVPHYSVRLFPLRIYTALKLTPSYHLYSTCLFPLRIYTALKRPDGIYQDITVCFPYEFTLLSNRELYRRPDGRFVSPTNLHCSQTSSLRILSSSMFVSPTNLHCSQTHLSHIRFHQLFVSPTNLHCSQTTLDPAVDVSSLFPLRIYTALKLRF